MFNYVQIKKKDEGYCVLHKKEKGYYLSRIDIAKSLNFEPVETGTKKDCVNFINNKNNGNNTGKAIQYNQNQNNQNQSNQDSFQDTNTQVQI